MHQGNREIVEIEIKMEAKACTIQCSHSCFVLSFLIAFLLLISNMQTASAANSTTKTYKTFLKTSCNSTTYPSVCYKSLSPYYSLIKTSSLKLCYAALSIALKTANNTSSLLSSLADSGRLSSTEKSIVEDCIEEISDSIDELMQSLKEIRNLGGSDKQFHIANIKTWVSAALTDEDTCLDGFDGQKVSSSVKDKIRKSILTLAKHTSNALALINLKY